MALSVRHQPVLLYQTAKHITQTTPYASQGLHFFGPKEFLNSIGSLQTAESKHTSKKIAIFLK